jgi:hypothetical protein
VAVLVLAFILTAMFVVVIEVGLPTLVAGGRQQRAARWEPGPVRYAGAPGPERSPASEAEAPSRAGQAAPPPVPAPRPDGVRADAWPDDGSARKIEREDALPQLPPEARMRRRRRRSRRG